jgi:signal transduction histidine kinase
MKVNSNKVALFGEIPSKKDELLTLLLAVNELKEKRPLKLEILELDHRSTQQKPCPVMKVLWANEAHLQEFPDLVGNVCYRYFNSFDRPCRWCPVIKTFKDGFTHIGFAASPKKSDRPSLVYTWIISVPYARNNSGEVSRVLEIMYDYTNEESKLFDEGLDKHRLGTDFGELIVSAHSKEEVAILLLCGLLLGLPNEISEGSALLFATNSGEYEYAQVVDHYNLLREAISPSIANMIRNQHVANPSLIRGYIPARIVKETAKKTVLSLFDEYEAHFLPKEEWMPTRIGHRAFGILLPHIDEDNDCLLIFRVTNNNDLLFDSTLSIATLLISMFRRVLEIRENNALSQIAYENLQRNLNTLTEGGDNLVDLLPFLLGKVHDFNLIFKLQKDVLHTIRFMEVGDELKKAKSHLMDKVKSITQDLEWLTNSMRSVTAIKVPYFKNEDIQELINGSILPFEHRLKDERIVCKLPKTRNRIYLECDPSLLRQVFINLTDNSIKALSYIKGRQKSIEVRLGQVEDDIEVDFEDNGGGIHNDIIPQIFERYFTTRPGGTGLGLFFVKKIVEDVHKGRITVNSVWGRGTLFKIFLPLDRCL